MFETKSGLRTIATLFITAATLVASSLPANAATQYPKTVDYLATQFVDHKYLVGFTPGKADLGMSLEAMVTLLAAGRDAKAQAAAVNYNLKSTSNIGLWSNQTGALYTPDRRLIVSDAGKYLFTYGAFNLPATALSNDVLSALKKHIAADGSLLATPDNWVAASQNVWTSAWVVLGLRAVHENKLAQRVAQYLATLAVRTGGFADNQTDSPLVASPDATGIALQALAATKALGTKSEETKKSAIIASARKWIGTIAEKDSNGNFISSWGEWSANSTGYVAMGLKATGSKISSYSNWLKSKISSADSGIQAGSWTNGAGNAYATLQSYVALIGKSYLDLIK